MLSIPSRELEALRRLHDSAVQYLLVGGHAVRHYGVERRTEDVDVFASRTPENAVRLYAAIVNILGRLPDFDWAVLTEPKKHINFEAGEPNLGAHVERRSAIRWADRISAPLLIMHGGGDTSVSPSHALQLAAALQRIGKPYELVIVAGARHVMDPFEAERDERAIRWFRRHLPASAQ